jgi:hypothetical protein
VLLGQGYRIPRGAVRMGDRCLAVSHRRQAGCDAKSCGRNDFDLIQLIYRENEFKYYSIDQMTRNNYKEFKVSCLLPRAMDREILL